MTFQHPPQFVTFKPDSRTFFNHKWSIYNKSIFNFVSDDDDDDDEIDVDHVNVDVNAPFRFYTIVNVTVTYFSDVTANVEHQFRKRAILLFIVCICLGYI